MVLCLFLCLLFGCSPKIPDYRSIMISNMRFPEDILYVGATEPIIRINSYEMISEDREVFSSGTGFIIERNKKRFLVTAYHVIQGSTRIQYFTHDYKKLSIELGKVYLIPNMDSVVAELIFCSATVKPLKMGKYIQDGTVTTSGFPHGGEFKQYKGINFVSRIESTAIVEVGMSGGPVFDQDGNVIGIISAKTLGGGPIKSLFSRLEDVFDGLDHK